MEDAAPPPLQPEGTPPLLQPGVDFTFQRRDRRAVYLTRTWHRLQTNTANVDVAHYCEGAALLNSISTAHIYFNFYYKFTFSTADAGQRSQTARMSSSIRQRGGAEASDDEDSIGGVGVAQ
ncbi:uncharacterized protein [Triticum aestivum]|uniref:uncharacterized protein isoform X1 n=1 Tax=Triticum aestivum TaxID=4565 RepID=UPI001D02651C|nr:uncharacterized protein LOC123078247 isoform X1 [Triticum aestivum]